MINKDTIVIIKGKKFTVEDFMKKYGVPTEDQAMALMTKAVAKGRATVYNSAEAEEEFVNSLQDDIEFDNIIDKIEEEQYQAMKAERQAKAEEVDLINIKLTFKSSQEAVEAETWINSLGIDDTEISIKQGVISLIVKGITPGEHTKIATKYQLEKAINKTVETASKTIVGTTNTVNYIATKVVAPTAKIAGEAGMNLGKGLVHTTAKVGAGLINSGSKAIADTKVSLATDTEMLKAKKELKDAKDSLVSFFKKKTGANRRRSGIEVID